MHIDHLDTPAVVIDLDKLDANIARLQRYLDQHKIANRPHIKTHKIPEIAHMQIRAGAVGITCQKIGEAEIMAQAGIRDIFLPYNILGPAKLERLLHLAQRIDLSVTADSAVTVDGYAGAFGSRGVELPVLVEFDCGTGRCGVQTPQEAASLAGHIARADGLHFAGLMTYPYNEDADQFVQETRRLLTHDGLIIEQVSAGGTPRMWHTHEFSEPTEHRAGTYVYGDRSTIRAGSVPLEECAMRVLTTVVSRPTPERAILDGGSKTFTSDTLGFSDYGTVIDYPEASLHKFSEEHGFVDLSASAVKPVIGERVAVIPNHCCVVTNMHNQVYGVRGDQVEVIWPVAARGLVQ
ncbi:MAG: D-TA family PLP-dependent enzyme [Caldilineaceae bacterium]|nr:D-TA family PLP-dependent enzyme [Caldilineaceae bacterium]